MSNEEVGAPERKFDDLDDVLSSGLGHDMRAKATAVPPTRPPSAIGLVMLELSR